MNVEVIYFFYYGVWGEFFCIDKCVIIWKDKCGFLLFDYWKVNGDFRKLYLKYCCFDFVDCWVFELGKLVGYRRGVLIWKIVFGIW